MYTKVHKITPGYTNVQTATPRCKMYTNIQKSTPMYTNVHKGQKGTQRYNISDFPTVYYMLTTLLLYEGLQSSSKIGKFHFIIRTVERSRETESCTLESWIFTRLLSKTTVFMLESKLETCAKKMGKRGKNTGFWRENCYWLKWGWNIQNIVLELSRQKP